MNDTFYQLHLRGKSKGIMKHSGRGVRIRELGIADMKRAREIAAGKLTKGANGAQMALMIDEIALRMAIVEVTRDAGLEALEHSTVWMQVTEESQQPDGEHAHDKLFKGPDLILLERAYNYVNGVGGDDVDDVVGGMLTVSAG